MATYVKVRRRKEFFRKSIERVFAGTTEINLWKHVSASPTRSFQIFRRYQAENERVLQWTFLHMYWSLETNVFGDLRLINS